jgi:hypothetical protein
MLIAKLAIRFVLESASRKYDRHSQERSKKRLSIFHSLRNLLLAYAQITQILQSICVICG